LLKGDFNELRPGKRKDAKKDSVGVSYSDIHVQSRAVRSGRSGLSIAITPDRAGWDLVGFTVRTIARGDTWAGTTGDRELCVVLLSGHCTARWRTRSGSGRPRSASSAGSSGSRWWSAEGQLGPRAGVFDAYPHALYLPRGSRVVLVGETESEVALCAAPSDRDLPARLVHPGECGFEIRGGGNATRQIIDILPPPFPADRLMICEVLTPAGNWSSYPPHKHDSDRPPVEVDLEEIYYFRFRQPHGFGYHRVYTADGRRDETMTVRDRDLVIVREGYHPFVTAYGHDAYYLNVLAGTRRSMASSDDPRYAGVRDSWPAPDPRVPMIARPVPQ
jgi:5-deoxy-glucuronate isomerase